MLEVTDRVSALHFCMGYLDLVKWLVVSAGENVTEVDKYGRTALMIAVRGREDGHVAAVLLYAASLKNFSLVQFMLTSAGQSVVEELWFVAASRLRVVCGRAQKEC